MIERIDKLAKNTAAAAGEEGREEEIDLIDDRSNAVTRKRERGLEEEECS